MKFPLAAVFFLVFSFIFFISWVISTYLVNSVKDALAGPAAETMNSVALYHYNDLLTILPVALGFLCVLFFIFGIILLFVLESWSDEPEYFYR